MSDKPNFAAWSVENLAKFASEAYDRMQEQQAAMEQSRGDLRDAMNLLRDLQTQGVNDANIKPS